jgi:predicted enzyme related to lactoylglutathione lyase
MEKQEEHGGSRKDNQYCVHCCDASGKLKSREDIRKGMILFHMKMFKKSRDEAEKEVDEHMKHMPAWGGKKLSNASHTICHFEIPADNVTALKEFYEKLFGWKITKAEGPFEYCLIETGGVGGGMRKRDSQDDRINIHIKVESVDEYSKKITKLGGKVLVPKQSVPGFGFVAFVSDPQGNAFGIWEDSKKA